MATNTKSETSTTKSTEKTVEAQSSIEKMVEENTPGFISKNFTLVVNNLESFRVNHFNSPYIFYPILGIVVFLIVRAIWRRFF